MPDVGTLVTDVEVQNFLPGVPSVSADAKIPTIIKAVEAAVRKATGRQLLSATYSEEEYSIRPPRYAAGLPQKYSSTIQLKEYPVTTFTSLKVVGSRNASDGLVASSTTLDKNVYNVDTVSGIIRLYNMFTPQAAILLQNDLLSTSSSFQTGVAIMLATYTAGYAAAAIPFDLKEAILITIAYHWQMRAGDGWHLSSKESHIGTTTYARNGFFPTEAKQVIMSYKRPSIGSTGL